MGGFVWSKKGDKGEQRAAGQNVGQRENGGDREMQSVRERGATAFPLFSAGVAFCLSCLRRHGDPAVNNLTASQSGDGAPSSIMALV